jgi:hypothetical protein
LLQSVAKSITICGMENQSTIRAEMKTRAAGLPGDSRLPPEDQIAAPAPGRKLIWVAIAVALLGAIWLVVRR